VFGRNMGKEQIEKKRGQERRKEREK